MEDKTINSLFSRRFHVHGPHINHDITIKIPSQTNRFYDIRSAPFCYHIHGTCLKEINFVAKNSITPTQATKMTTFHPLLFMDHKIFMRELTQVENMIGVTHGYLTWKNRLYGGVKRTLRR